MFFKEKPKTLMNLSLLPGSLNFCFLSSITVIHFNIVTIMLFSQFCNQEDMLYTTNCLKVTLSFQFLVIFVVSKVPDKRMHLDFVFEAFQGDNAYYQFTSLTAVIFPCKISSPWSGLERFHEYNTVWEESMCMNGQYNPSRVGWVVPLLPALDTVWGPGSPSLTLS